ncbi:MAG TPA: bifunctional diguanylate cyclase/phosphodiesterase, partial [Acidimicrobiales bacterium]|nr:bifunctional diguanylate cyclase/phosphodiesterase [Acidimicrobiales bacterium]
TVVYQIFGLGSVVAILVGIALHRPRHKLPWFIAAAGLALLSGADLWYSLYDLAWHEEAPYPSAADVPYLLGYATIAVALVLFARLRFPGRDRASLLDSLILGTSCALLAWVFLMAPYARDDTLSIVQRAVSVAYPVGGVMFVGLATRFVLVPGARQPAIRFLLATLVAWVAADSIYGVQVLDGTYDAGGPVDVGWLLGYLGWAAVALHPSMREITEPTAPRLVRLSSGRVVWLAIASLVAPLLLLWQALSDDVREVHVFAAAAAVLFMLVVARLAGVASELNDAAVHDALTRLPNRALFMHRLSAAIGTLEPGQRLAVLFIDLDRFKLVNDTLGHGAGDEVLLEMASRVRDAVGREGFAARLGGDEFVVLLERSELPAIVDLAERLEQSLSAPVQLRETPFFLSASIGVAIIDDRAEDPVTVLQQADLAMYRAKQRGKARYEIFDGTALQTGGRAHLERDLRDANDDGDQLEVWFEPVVRLRDGAIHGVEALLRWRHPERGVLPPAEFLDIAEETGLIVPVGQAVLRQACTQAERWRVVYGSTFTLYVNLSSRQLLQGDLVEMVRGALDASSLPAANLVLEINEDVDLAELGRAADKLAELRRDGVRVAVDDFGTGHSSLAYLRSELIDIVKLDRSFTSALTTSDRDRAVALGLVHVARDAGMTVIAEGVEVAEQVDVLLTSGLELGQGHLFAQATVATELETTFAPNER